MPSGPTNPEKTESGVEARERLRGTDFSLLVQLCLEITLRAISNGGHECRSAYQQAKNDAKHGEPAAFASQIFGFGLGIELCIPFFGSGQTIDDGLQTTSGNVNAKDGQQDPT